MATMDVFNSNAFSTTALSGLVQKQDFRPSLLGSLNLFEPVPVRSTNIFMDRINGKLTLIPTAPIGAPPAVLERDTRDAVSLKTTYLPKRFRLYAHEVDGLRAFGSETELQAVQVEYSRRTQQLLDDMELTHEHHRLGALQGLLLDADGTTVIYDYATEFGETIPAAISFELDVSDTDVPAVCRQIKRGMAQSSKGSFVPGTTVHALVGDAFYDALIAHPSVKETYLQQQAANQLREQQGQVFGSFNVGGITFHDYRGTDDGTTVAVLTDEAKFFPVGARNVFKVAYAPHQTMEFVNTPGQRVYAQNIPDRDRNMYTDGEIYSYPLYVCQQPRVLRRGTLT